MKAFKGKEMKRSETHDKLLQSLKESLNLLQESYNEFLEAKEYYEGNQLPDYIKTCLHSCYLSVFITL